MLPVPPITQLILKIASRCNLNCSYCYVYNKGDSTWKDRPPRMSDHIFEESLQNIRRHCALSQQKNLTVVFHGGEPCLIGVDKFDSWCQRVREVLKGIDVRLGIQTNGTLLTQRWTEAFVKHHVGVGLSMDGPRATHDARRIDHRGRGSYENVERGLRVLQASGAHHAVLCVIPLGAAPLAVHHHFVSLGCRQITYLFPDYTHDTFAGICEQYGPTPCADFLIPIFDDWWHYGTLELNIVDLRNMARVIMGGSSRIETLGNNPPKYVFVETDGEIEGLDSLRVCSDGIAKTNLNVLTSEFAEVLLAGGMHKDALFAGLPTPTQCGPCLERSTCAGGYLPHRFSRARGFDNPSVWCADLLKLFAHLRVRMEVPTPRTSPNIRSRGLLT